MAINYPGPYEVRIFYRTDEPVQIAEHVIRLSCDMNVVGSPGNPFSSWSATLRGGSGVVLDTAVLAVVNILKVFFKTTVDFVYAELWEYTPGTFDAIFRATYTIGVAGTSAAATVGASQTIVSFRTTGGGIFKVDMRGTTVVADVSKSFPTAITVVDALAAYFVGSSSPWVGRDGTYPLSAIKYLPGLNEGAWKVVNR